MKEENEQSFLHQLNEILCNQKTYNLRLQKYGAFFLILKVPGGIVHHKFM